MKSGIDLNKWDKRLESAKRCLELSDIPQIDKELILKFSNFKHISENVRSGRQTKYLHNLMVFARRLHEIAGKTFDTATREDIEAVVTSLYNDSQEWNDRTNHKLGANTIRAYLVILKTFYSWLKKCENPEETNWIKPPRIEPEKLKPDEIITWEDAVKLSRAALSHRDKALPLVLWESGLRIGELLCMNISDVEVTDNGMILHIMESKTEIRDVGIKRLVPALGEWLQNHPLRENPDAPLLVNLHGNNDRASPALMSGMLTQLAERCKLNKDVNPHRFRKSCASIFATNGKFSEAELKRRMGWSPDSRMLKIYVHLDDYKINQKYLNSEEEGVRCVWCNAINSPGESYCQTCKRPMNDDIIQKKTELERMIEELIEKKLNSI